MQGVSPSVGNLPAVAFVGNLTGYIFRVGNLTFPPWRPGPGRRKTPEKKARKRKEESWPFLPILSISFFPFFVGGGRREISQGRPGFFVAEGANDDEE